MKPALDIYKSEILQSRHLKNVTLPDPEVQAQHIAIIDQLINYITPQGTTVNIWDKLDFFYFFPGNCNILKHINWKDPNGPTGSFGNNYDLASYSYKYTNTDQYSIKRWYDSAIVGNLSSGYGSKSKYFALNSAGFQGQLGPAYNSSVSSSLIQYIPYRFSNSYTNVGILKQWVNKVVSPYTSSLIGTDAYEKSGYASVLSQMNWRARIYNDVVEYFDLPPTASQQNPTTFTFEYRPNPLIGEVVKYGAVCFRRFVTSSDYSQLGVPFGKFGTLIDGTNEKAEVVWTSSYEYGTESTDGNIDPDYVNIIGLATGSVQDTTPPSLNIKLTVTSIDTPNLTGFITKTPIHKIEIISERDVDNLFRVDLYGQDESLGFSRFPLSYTGISEDLKTNLTSFIENNPSYLISEYLSSNTGILPIYDPYSQTLELYNGTYYNTNFNFRKKQLLGNLNYKHNDGFIGYVKSTTNVGGFTFGPAPGSVISASAGDYNFGEGTFYLGASNTLNTSESIAISLDTVYYKSVSSSSGFQASLGRPITSSFKEVNYTWVPYLSTNPYPLSASYGGQTPSNTMTASNASSMHGRSGCYMIQSFLTSSNQTTTRQYFNHKNVREYTLVSSSADLPDGNLLINGLGRDPYVDLGYVLATTESAVAVPLGRISNVKFETDKNLVYYTSSGIIDESGLKYYDVNIDTLRTASFEDITSEWDYLPNGITLNQQFSASLSGTIIQKPIISGSYVHLGYGNNPIGIVTTSSLIYDSSNQTYTSSFTAVATKTTSSAVFIQNTVMRFYQGVIPAEEPSPVQYYPGISQATKDTIVNVTEITCSATQTLNNINTSDIFFIDDEDPDNLITYYLDPESTTNGQQSVTFNTVNGSKYRLSFNSHTSSLGIFNQPTLLPGYKMAVYKRTPEPGDQSLSQDQFNINYNTIITGSFLTSSIIENTNLYITDKDDNILYNSEYINTNGTFNFPTSSTSGSTFSVKYLGQPNNLSGLMSLVTTQSIIAYSKFNPDFNTEYVNPAFIDTKPTESSVKTSNTVCLFGGGGVGSVDLSNIYSIFYSDLYVNRGKVANDGLFPLYNQTQKATGWFDGTLNYQGGYFVTSLQTVPYSFSPPF